MKSELSRHDIIQYAEKVAYKLGVTLPSVKLIHAQLKDILPLPVIIKNSKYQLWIDMYYIAYSRYDEEEIHYVYITQNHINEEYKSYAIARALRKNKVCLPQNIKKSFRIAQKYINEKKIEAAKHNDKAVNYWLDKAFFEN